MKITPIPAFTDNYIWQINDGSKAFVVDPGEAQPVIQHLEENQLILSGILLTHHHFDHTSGVKALLELWPGIPVYGPANEDIPETTHPLSEGDNVHVLGSIFRVIDVPGHTAGHIAYYNVQEDDHDILFCGDTLFSSGCGRLFEGTAAQMYESLSKLKALPAETLVYCTHEYTTANLNFARAVEPENADIAARIQQVAELRDQDLPSLPSTLGLELRVNPFLRWDAPAVIKAANEHSETLCSEGVEVFATIRAWKDHF